MLLGIALCLLAGVGGYFAARSWLCHQALQAIEVAIDAKAEADSVELELFSGRLHLQGVRLTARSTTAFWEKLALEKISGQIQWSAWSSGKIPMTVRLENGVLSLRPIAPLKWTGEPFRASAAPSYSSPFSSSNAPGSLNAPTDAISPAPATENRKVVLSKIEAQNITVVESRTQLPLAAGINGVAQRALAGWRGQLTAASLGPEALPLTQVKLDFSTETAGTRLAQLRCNLREGRLSGSGWYADDGAASLELKAEALPLAALTAWLHAPNKAGQNGMNGVTGAGGFAALDGQLSADFHYQGDAFRWSQSAATGSFSLKNATLKLPATVVTLLALTGSKTESLGLERMGGKFSRTPERWALSDLALYKQNHLAIVGGLQSVPDTDGQKNRMKAELRIGIAKTWLASLGLAWMGENLPGETGITVLPGGEAGSGSTNSLPLNAATSTAPSAADFQWITLNMEAAPEQLWQQLWQHCLAVFNPTASASNTPNSVAPNDQTPAPSVPQQLQQKAKDAVGTMLNLLTP